MKKIILLGMALLLCLPLIAQTNTEDNEFWGSSDSYLQRQTARALDLVNQALQEYPPMVGNVTPRRLALSNLDAILHNTIFDKSEPLMQFVSTRIQQVIAGLQAPLQSDMAIYKLYNDGFIVRTQSATVAFDMVMGSTYQYIPDELMAQLVDQCDILFLSHNHRDHVDPGVVKLFTDRGKQVVALRLCPTIRTSRISARSRCQTSPSVCQKLCCKSRYCQAIKTSCKIISMSSPPPKDLLLHRQATSTSRKTSLGLSSYPHKSLRLMCCSSIAGRWSYRSMWLPSVPSWSSLAMRTRWGMALTIVKPTG